MFVNLYLFDEFKEKKLNKKLNINVKSLTH